MDRAADKRPWWVRYRWPLAIGAAAVLVRVVWTVWVHPPRDFVYSDMASYLMRAHRFALAPSGGPWPDEPFFPWGTHYVLGGLILAIGRDAPILLGALWGVLNAPIAPLAYFMAGRLHGGAAWSATEHGPVAPEDDPDDPDEQQAMTRAVARVAGCFMVVYYPALSYAGFYLSESPFMVLVTAAALLSLVLVDHGHMRHAVLLGLVFAMGFAVRPQILAAVGLLTAFVMWRRRLFPELRWRHALAVFLPLAATLVFSAALSHRHTGRWTPLPHNGAVNRVFGRCHNFEMRAKDAMFGPPAFGALHRNELAHPDALITLRPAIDPQLKIDGSMGDEAALHALADRCVAESGPLRQAYYAATHVILLWGYHVAWPDMGLKPFRFHMRGWSRAHLIVFALPCLIGMALGSTRRHARHGILAMFVWSLIASVMLFMGAARFRIPYDVISVVIGLDVYGRGAVLLTRFIRLRQVSSESSRNRASDPPEELA